MNTKPEEENCVYYTRTGNCTKPQCPFKHEPGRIAFCHTLLSTRHKCLNKVCHYSHDPNQYNSPSCKFFQENECDIETCIFTHKKESVSSPICREFAFLGYCHDGLKCRFIHSFDCPDVKEYGRCFRGQSCSCTHNNITDKSSDSTKIRNKDNDNVIQIVYDKNDDDDDNSDEDEMNNSSESDDNVEFIVGPNDLSKNTDFVRF